MLAKSFSHFTYQDLRNLGLSVSQRQLFDSNLPNIEPSDWLKKAIAMAQRIPKATEKAKSELIVSPILVELLERNNFSFSLFSGYTLEVDKARGLKGQFDFLLSKTPNKPFPDSPLFAVVEAKKGDFELGIPQLIAQLYAATLFNERYNQPLERIYGAVTIGSEWNFVEFRGQGATIDDTIYYTSNLSQLLGVFQHIFDSYE